jgi:hypothetical protein
MITPGGQVTSWSEERTYRMLELFGEDIFFADYSA